MVLKSQKIKFENMLTKGHKKTSPDTGEVSCI